MQNSRGRGRHQGTGKAFIQPEHREQVAWAIPGPVRANSDRNTTRNGRHAVRIDGMQLWVWDLHASNGSGRAASAKDAFLP